MFSLALKIIKAGALEFLDAREVFLGLYRDYSYGVTNVPLTNVRCSSASWLAFLTEKL